MWCLKYLILFNICLYSHGVFRKNGISISNNGYENILIAIHEDVAENSQLVDKIKQSFTSASKFLYSSTRHRAYFRHITILLPQTWADSPEYQQAKSEYYNNADIIINPFSIDIDNSPLVKTYRGCGEPGEYMQMSEHYLLNETFRNDFGPIEKSLVHEWAHLRWGVFDEYPEDDTDKKFFYSADSESWEPVRCTQGLQGRIVNLKTGKDCTLSDSGRYDNDCDFYPYVDQGKYVTEPTNASIMDRQYVDTIQHFCENSNKTTGHKHNKQSPSKHSVMCGELGTWDVIVNTTDFANSANPPFNIGSDESKLTPTFTLKRHKQGFNKVVLVLDESGSMVTANRLTRMVQAVGRFIRNGLTTGTEVGVVMFDTTARILVPLTNLASAKIREDIVKKLPTNTGSSTAIGKGLRLALTMIPNGGVIILISDGEENVDPRIADVKPDILSAEVVVHCIAFTQAADKSMGSLAKDTGGLFEYEENLASTTTLDMALSNLASILNSAITTSNPSIESFLYSKEYDAGETVTNSTYLIDGLGNKTTLILSYITSAPSFNVSSPSGIVYNNNFTHVYNDVRSKMVILSIPGIAENGQWIIRITNNASVSQRIATSFSSYPTKQGDVFVLNVRTTEEDNVWPPRVVIKVDAMKGGKPVIGLNVTVTATRPNHPSVKITLLDNGLAADLKANDGIYSRYFTKLTGSGRYSFSVTAEAHPNTSRIVSRRAGQSGAVRLDPMNITDETVLLIKKKREIKTDIIKGGISATSSGGALDFTPPPEKEKTLLAGDIYPPNKITDLRVLSTDFNKPSVKLEFTAPGDDYDDGTATRYIMLYKNTTSDWMPIDDNNVISGNITSPKPSGEIEQFEIMVPYNKKHNVSYTFKVQAEDEVGHQGPLSNSVSAGFGTVPPLVEITTTDPFTNLITKDLFTTLMTTAEYIETTTPNRIYTEESTGEKLSTSTGTLTSTPKRKLSLFEKHKVPILAGSIAGGVVLLIIIGIAVFLTKRKRGKVSMTTI